MLFAALYQDVQSISIVLALGVLQFLLDGFLQPFLQCLTCPDALGSRNPPDYTGHSSTSTIPSCPGAARHPQQLETCSVGHNYGIQLHLQVLKEKYKNAGVTPSARKSKPQVGTITGEGNQHLGANGRWDVRAPVLHQFTGLLLSPGYTAVPEKTVSQGKGSSSKRILFPRVKWGSQAILLLGLTKAVSMGAQPHEASLGLPTIHMVK